MKLARVAMSSVAVLQLAACGGDGGSSVASTPAPVPTRTPTPTQSPAYSSFTSLNAAVSVPMTGVLDTYITDYSTNPSTDHIVAGIHKTYSNSNLYFAYDPAARAYTITDQSRSQTFSQSDLNPSFQFRGSSFDTYAKLNQAGAAPGTTREDYLTVYRADGGVGSTKVVLTYTTLAEWISKEFSSNTTTATRTDLVGGFETKSTDMPKSGVATYLGPALANYSTTFPVAPMDGTTHVTADFSKGTLSAELFLNRSGQSTLNVTGTGNIQANSNRFGGSLSGGGFAGPMDGAFYGPQAKEVGFSYSLTDGAGAHIDGVAAGR